MEFEIRPATPAGERYVELCEQHAADFATRSEQHDRERSFPFENIEALKESGFFRATVPEELGGFGIESVQDLAAGMNRLARGDGSTAIAANMHIGVPFVVTRMWRDAQERGDDQAVEEHSMGLQMLAETIACAAQTEAGTSVGYPLTEATRSEGGWLLSGRKIFGTLSPAADMFIVSARFLADGGEWGSLNAFVFRGAPGFTVNDDWDALGMRASGSNSLLLEQCFVDDALVNVQAEPWGVLEKGFLTNQISANLTLSAAMVGIAEHARNLAIDLVKTRRKAPSNRLLAERTGIQYQVAEMEIDLATARAMIERTASVLDACLQTHLQSEIGFDDLHELMCDFQCTKWVANRKAIEVVDRALTLSGGTGYFNSSPLSRLYRDVRAGPFMQAYSPNEAREYIGRITLGLGPALDL